MPQADVTPEFLHADASGVSVRLQPDLYGESAVAAALHRFTDRCFVHLERADGGWLLCRVVPKREQDDARLLAGQLANEMLDQMLRHRLSIETEPIRRLILAQAFSRTNVAHPELDDADPAQDPLQIGAPDAPFRQS
jgi:His-Xaa-Ser system protein HxsD